MILPGLPIPSAMKVAASDPYSIISGGDQGFVKEGGVVNNLGAPASGSEQGTLLDGFVVDAVTNTDFFNIIFQGDATTSLSGLSSVLMNEDEFFVQNLGYNEVYDFTFVGLGESYPFVDGVTYTVELVFT